MDRRTEPERTGDLTSAETSDAGSWTEPTGLVARFRQNPAGWGIALGAAIAFLSVFFVWIQVTNSAGDSQRYRAISNYTGQTVFFAAIMAGIAALGATVATSGWRFVWDFVGLVMGGLIIAAGIWALTDPVGFTKHATDANAYASMTAHWSLQNASDALSKSFSSGELSASGEIGAILGVVAGALIVLGSLLSFGRRPPLEE